jgi:hypothetical protein
VNVFLAERIGAKYCFVGANYGELFGHHLNYQFAHDSMKSVVITKELFPPLFMYLELFSQNNSHDERII